jgi:hypothetical protein
MKLADSSVPSARHQHWEADTPRDGQDCKAGKAGEADGVHEAALLQATGLTALPPYGLAECNSIRVISGDNPNRHGGSQ